ncbi:LacI family DNA-binding transcriptional regulator [Tabrizicola sp.]|uniref:LacI family DNA-binding transcriptional regulator n=1 Tax=Tabrizicola sp. TaxID=2005166 RepID=UPI00286CADDE|nr:LacI family DNA-binding transcriptional regulator [Tabrizicola sp.]
MQVTLKQVAAQAGVSTSAVSRTFTEGASVSDKTRHKVETAAAALGYSPNVLASSLTTGRTKMIGLVSNNFHNPVFLEVFDQFTSGLQAKGLRPLLVNLSDVEEPDGLLRLLRQYSVDGVIIASSTVPPAFPRAFTAAGIPIVHSFGRYSASQGVHVVGIDNIDCGRIAARTLVARGYQRVGFLGGPATATTTQDRWTGFQQELSAHPQIHLSHSFAAAYSYDAGEAEMARLLTGTPAEAYFCGDDVLSIGAMSAIRTAGLCVPEDIGILGLNDMEMSRWALINLTTIRQPIPEIIAASLDVIVSQIEDPGRSTEARIFPCALVERGTLRPLPAGISET